MKAHAGARCSVFRASMARWMAGVEIPRTVERPVGQVVALQVAPGALGVVQLRGGPRQPLDPEFRPRGKRLPAHLARVDRAVVRDQDHRPALPARRWAVLPVEPRPQGSEVAGALGPAGDDASARAAWHGLRAAAEERAPSSPARASRPAGLRRAGLALDQVGWVSASDSSLARGGCRRPRLPLHQPEPRAGAVDGAASCRPSSVCRGRRQRPPCWAPRSGARTRSSLRPGRRSPARAGLRSGPADPTPERPGPRGPRRASPPARVACGPSGRRQRRGPPGRTA